MKKKISISLILVFFVLFFSCNKNQEELTEESSDIKMEDYYPESFQGILKFQNSSDAIKFMNLFNSTRNEDILKLYRKLDFNSMNDILLEIAKEEEIFENHYYANVPEGLSIEKLNDLGVEIQHSEFYKKCFLDGIIFETIEDDGSVTFEPTISDPVKRNILNADGMVIIADTLYQFSQEYIKLIRGHDLLKIETIKKATANDPTIGLFVKKADLRLKGYTTRIIDDTGWIYRGSNLRVKAIYRLYDAGSDGVWFEPATCVTITQNLELKAEEKRFFTWKVRNSYMPFQEVSGDFDVCIKSNLNHIICSFDCSDFGAGYQSPIFLDSFLGSSTVNHVILNLCPNGQMCLYNEKYDGISSNSYHFIIKARYYDDIILSSN